MGILSNLREKLEKKRQSRINEEEFEKILKELKEIDSISIMDEETKSFRRQYLLKSFAKKIEDGTLKFEIENVNKKEPLEIAESVLESSYPGIKEVGKEIRFTKMFERIEDIMLECITYLGIHKEDYEKIEEIALEFYKRYPDDKSRDLKMTPLTDIEIHNIICSYFEKGISNEEYLEEVFKRMDVFSSNKVIGKIRSIPDLNEQERLYEEYIHDFLGGIEDSSKHFVRTFSDSEFMQRRIARQKCERYGVEYEGKAPIIYETGKIKFESLKEANLERINERRYENPTVSDLVLVRTTNVFPEDGVVETLDKHTMPEFQASLFKKEIEESGLKLDDFKTYSFVNRRTSHWTLNGLVSSHMYGNFEGRNFIIVEPLEEQIEHDGLLNIDEADTYFYGDLRLSDRAIILMKLEEYKERYKDPVKREEMKKKNIRLFVGDENIAVQALLHDLGYVFEKVDMWGYESDDKNPELKYARKLELLMVSETERLQRKGKVLKTGRHFDSESREIDLLRMFELEEERIDRFVDLLAENTDVNFSPKYLKRVFKNRMQDIDDIDYHYLDEEIEEAEGLENMGPQDVFEKVGPEKIKEITLKYNEMILEEHRKARREKDAELVKKGWKKTPERDGQEIGE